MIRDRFDSFGSVLRRVCAVTVALVLGIAFLAAPAVAAGAQETAERPDLTGIWTWYRGGDGGPLGSGWPENPPLTEKAEEKIAEYQALVEPTGDTPGGFCLGTGMPGSMLGSGGYPMEIIQRPEQITIIYEAHSEIRRVYLKGPHTEVPEKDLFPTRLGYSTGHWEGDTLVVETTHLKEQVDQQAAHSDKARIVARYNLTRDDEGRKVLKAEMTMTDPAFYTEPVTVTKRWQAVPDDEGRMLYYNCNEPAWEEHLKELRAKAETSADTAN